MAWHQEKPVGICNTYNLLSVLGGHRYLPFSMEPSAIYDPNHCAADLRLLSLEP